jgi:hypothetical protein
MIKPGEIQNKAREVGVRDQQIEKDYILSWILQGIAQHEQLSTAIVFKGGTVLKKVYFEDYRFSEDLDFTLLDNDILNEQIFEWFSEVFEYIQEEANIPLEIIDPDNHRDRHEHEDGGINFYISYVGPLGGIGANNNSPCSLGSMFHDLCRHTPRMNDVFYPGITYLKLSFKAELLQ